MARHARELPPGALDPRAIGRGEPVRTVGREAFEPLVERPRDFDGKPEQRVVADREERAPERPGQRHGVGRVLHGREEVDQVEDFLLREEPRPADDVEVEPLGHQGPLVHRRIAQRPEQDCHVAGVRRADGSRARIADRPPPGEAVGEVARDPAGFFIAPDGDVGLAAAPPGATAAGAAHENRTAGGPSSFAATLPPGRRADPASVNVSPNRALTKRRTPGTLRKLLGQVRADRLRPGRRSRIVGGTAPASPPRNR